jgi:hypothetical protein
MSSGGVPGSDLKEAAMRRCRAALTALTVVLMSVLVAGPASAGGPTSVLLVESVTGTASSLYYTDADYETLSDLVGVNKPVDTATADAVGPIRDFGGGVTMTWLIHDVAVWRVDRVFVGDKSGPWIATQSDMNVSGNVYDSPVTWHRATDGPALVAFLERKGFGGAPTASAGAAGAPVPDFASATPAPVQKTSQPASPTSTWGGWAWGLAGLALGLALALAGPRLFSRVRRALVARAEAESAEDGSTPVRETQSDPDDETQWTPADELSWSGSPRG